MTRTLSLLLFPGLPLALVGALIWMSYAHSWSGEATGWGISAILGAATAIDIFVSKRMSERRHRA
jgi:hypothetical protein